MSNYTTKAYHPTTGELETVAMIDNYFGHYEYGVKFPDGDIFPVDHVDFPKKEGES